MSAGKRDRCALPLAALSLLRNAAVDPPSRSQVSRGLMRFRAHRCRTGASVDWTKSGLKGARIPVKFRGLISCNILQINTLHYISGPRETVSNRDLVRFECSDEIGPGPVCFSRFRQPVVKKRQKVYQNFAEFDHFFIFHRGLSGSAAART